MSSQNLKIAAVVVGLIALLIIVPQSNSFVVLLVSRVGEILRVEFPGGLKLINDVLYAT